MRSAIVMLMLAGLASAARPGGPLPGIGPRDFELFRLGLDDFNEVESPEEGLGPAFNGTSCAQCHSVPAIGGIAAMSEIRAGHLDDNGKFTALRGETLFNLFSTGNHSCQVQIPAEANVIARRVPIPVFGAGLVEAIPDSAILALEAGGRGRAARIVDKASGQVRIGRFGWKAQHATLLAFSGDAYRNEMGITNDLFRDELAPGVTPEQMKLCDPIAGIEDVHNRSTGLRAIDNFENFMRFLAPIARGPIDGDVLAGERIFETIGCASCHVPTLMTGPNANPLFDRKRVDLFSDLLLHDIGTGDGIEQDDAKGNEIRTPALWGLRMRRPLLHDGSAATPLHAIRAHRDQTFDALTPEDQRVLLAFLNSL